jgi:hypothetical protein
VEECGEICFSCGRLPLFFLHVRVLSGALAFDHHPVTFLHPENGLRALRWVASSFSIFAKH